MPPHRPPDRRPLPTWRPVLAALVALAALATALWRLEAASTGLTITRSMQGSTPVTVFRPAGGSSTAPVALIAHGFAGSQQLMQPIAQTLARNGWVAITFDFPGHGRNPVPMRGGLADPDESLRVLLAALGEMGGYARGLAPDGRYAVLGHSMASDIVVRHAQADRAVQATVGISLFAPSIRADTPPDSPRNLLVIDGALEPSLMADEALRVVGRVAGPAPRQATTYGRFADGTARRATLSRGAEHIGVLYAPDTLAETLAWLDAAFDRTAPATPVLDTRGTSLALLLAGVVLLAWPLSRLLPRVAEPGVPRERLRWWRWRGQAPLTLLPALATPLLLWPLPSDVLPILLGDYLVLHFALYGVLTLAGLFALGRRPPPIAPGRLGAFVWAVLLASVFGLLVVAVPLDRYVFNVWPPAVRLPVVAALCAGTLPYFLADEWLARDPAAPRLAYFASKAAFLLSLVIAIALNPMRLFFLAIIVPAILLLFVLYGLFSRWTGRRTGHPAVAAVANAIAFGCLIAVTFPLVR